VKWVPPIDGATVGALGDVVRDGATATLGAITGNAVVSGTINGVDDVCMEFEGEGAAVILYDLALRQLDAPMSKETGSESWKHVELVLIQHLS
jgi:hypothetical protein